MDTINTEKTFYWYSIETFKAGESSSSYMSGSSKSNCMGGAISDANREASYYLREFPGSRNLITIEATCKQCGNEKTVRVYSKKNKFVYKTVKCPMCKGVIDNQKTQFELS